MGFLSELIHTWGEHGIHIPEEEDKVFRSNDPGYISCPGHELTEEVINA